MLFRSADNPVGVGAFTASVGVLLALELRAAPVARKRRLGDQVAGA